VAGRQQKLSSNESQKPKSSPKVWWKVGKEGQKPKQRCKANTQPKVCKPKRSCCWKEKKVFKVGGGEGFKYSLAPFSQKLTINTSVLSPARVLTTSALVKRAKSFIL
jgi:hypothetical protein